MQSERTARKLRSRAQRRWQAALAATLYGVLLLGLPGLHLLTHSDDHDHIAGGLRIRRGLLAEHGHDHGHPHRPPAPARPAPPTPAPAPPGHVEGSVAHFAVGLLPVLALPEVPQAGLLPQAGPPPAPPARPSEPPTAAPPPARGPPASV